MIKKINIIIVAMFSLLLMTSAGDDVKKGIEFQKITLEKAKTISKLTGKPIFIDCYTDWCGPCKRMAKTAFVDQKVGELYNSSFINLKVEMEKNADGREISRMYKINAYPTLLMIDAEGRLQKKVVGMQNAGGLIQLANSVLKK
tara:strand:+ start:166 stop:597 length:432 start_codon:yes stop_codon:yes gene_type:complete